MYTLLMIVHLVDCFLLVAAVLLQAGKGAEVGAAFGGSSQTIFGSRGAATFLSKITIGAAMIFFLTSLGLSILSKERSVISGLVNDVQKPTGTKQEAPKAEARKTIPSPVPPAPSVQVVPATPPSPAPVAAPAVPAVPAVPVAPQ